MAKKPEAPAAPKAPTKTKVFVVRVLDKGVLMSVDEFAKNVFSARFAVGDRVLLHGYFGGAPTGRAKLLRKEALWVSTWAWSRGAEDPARILEPLSLEPAPEITPAVLNLVDKTG